MEKINVIKMLEEEQEKENLINTLIFRLDSETSLFANKNEEFNTRSTIIYEFISTITSGLDNHYDVTFGWKPIFCNKKSNSLNILSLFFISFGIGIAFNSFINFLTNGI